jgi:hypothetical protein
MFALAACGVLASQGLRAGEFPDNWTWDGDPQLLLAEGALS